MLHTGRESVSSNIGFEPIGGVDTELLYANSGEAKRQHYEMPIDYTLSQLSVVDLSEVRA